MKTVVSSLLIAGTTLCAAAVQSAHADVVIISFGYQQLSGNFTPGGNNDGQFTAFSTSIPNSLQSTGNTNREVPTTGSANFAPGFDQGNAADGEFFMVLNLTAITNTSANATGQFRIRDVGVIGDTISGDISGTWNLTNPGLPFFSGVLSNVMVVNNSGDNVFNGTGGSGFGMGGLPPNPLSGQLQTLLIYFNVPQSFAGAFADISTNVQGQLIPAPGALALLGVGGLVATRRRR